MDVISIKSEIYESILAGDVSKSVIDKLLKSDGSILAKECELWDFKQTFEGSKDAYLKTMKSIVSFHNTFGGYIIFGVEEVEKDTVFKLLGIEKGLIDQQKLRGTFDRFFSRRIDLTYEEIVISHNSKDLLIGLLHIPKRAKKINSLAPLRDGTATDGKIILLKNANYIRQVDECKQVIGEDDFKFLASGREFQSIDGRVPERKNIIEHNLPDQNFICPVFIGRIELLQQLWSWLSDDFQYTKVLAAEGGKGKTSIAYEFCQLLIKTGNYAFEQVIWLTAKKRQFKASHDGYIETPETHYKDLESLLIEICLRTGSLEEEVQDFELHQLQRTAKDSLKVIPSLVVIDDIDSNTPDEQRRIMEIARYISSTSSRVLLTTRANNIYSSDSSILVPGLKGQDYTDLVYSICETLKLPKFNEKKIKKLNIASDGSPLFTESILRLCKLGYSVDNAISDWSGKSGDSVREAALRKEVSELSSEAIKILLTISSVGSSLSRSELHKYTDLENSEISKSIEQLDNLFLINSVEFIKEEPRFESTASISKLVLSVANDILPNAEQFLQRVGEIAAGLEANGKKHIPEVGQAISQCNSHLKDEEFSLARKTVCSLINQPRFKENSDLYFMLAKTEYEDPTISDEVVRKAFSEAFIKGQRKPVFFEMWYQIEISSGTNISVHDVCEHARNSIGKYDLQWVERYAHACYDLAMSAASFKKKILYLVKCYENSSKLMKNLRGEKWSKYKALNVRIVNMIWNESMDNSSYEIAGKAMMNAINSGDIRSTNFYRLIELSPYFLDEKLVSNETFQEYLKVIEWAPKLIRSNGSSREGLALKLDQEHNRLKLLKNNRQTAKS